MNVTESVPLSPPSIAPRPEAGVLSVPSAMEPPLAPPWPLQPLTPEQNDVALRVQGLLNAMADVRSAAPLRSTFAFLPRIEPQRESRVILIDGPRGSGKTSVLLTLLDFWSRLLLREAPRSTPTWPTPPHPIVPVGLIDLQALPASTNLALHIASALRQIIEAMEGQTGGQPPAPPWHPSPQRELASRRQWRQFFKAAAVGWASNLLERQRELDREAFALELEQAERERLDVTRCFYDLISALVEDLQKWRELPTSEQPFLVVSIDDADMNPDFSVGLLSLLHALYHPRLAFLLTGTNELIQIMLRTQRFGTLCGPMHAVDLDKTAAAELQHEADLLAWRTYQKLLPEHQRCRIKELPPPERFMRMREVLDRAALRTDEELVGQPASLSTYFTLAPQTTEALPATMRGIIDLRLYLDMEDRQTPASSAEPRLAAKLIKRLWDDAVHAAFVSLDHKHFLTSSIRITEQGNLLVRGEDVSWNLIRVPVTRLSIDEAFTVCCSYMEPLGASIERSTETKITLSSDAVGAFMLATIVALDDREDTFLSTPPTRQGFDAGLILAEYHSRGAAPLMFGWPLPPMSLLLDLLIIADHWGTLMRNLSETSAATVEQLALCFLDIIVATRQSRNPRAVMLRRDADLPETRTPLWQDVATRVAQLAEQPRRKTTRERLFGQWALEKAGLLAAPESGLPDTAAECFLQSLSTALGERWSTARGALRTARRQRAGFAMKKGGPGADAKEVEKLLKAIDGTRPSSPWSRWVEQPTTRATSGPPTPRHRPSKRTA